MKNGTMYMTVKSKTHTISTKCQYSDTHVMNECRCGVNRPAAARSVVIAKKITPMETCSP